MGRKKEQEDSSNPTTGEWVCLKYLRRFALKRHELWHWRRKGIWEIIKHKHQICIWIYKSFSDFASNKNYWCERFKKIVHTHYVPCPGFSKEQALPRKVNEEKSPEGSCDPSMLPQTRPVARSRGSPSQGCHTVRSSRRLVRLRRIKISSLELVKKTTDQAGRIFKNFSTRASFKTWERPRGKRSQRLNYGDTSAVMMIYHDAVVLLMSFVTHWNFDFFFSEWLLFFRRGFWTSH